MCAQSLDFTLTGHAIKLMGIPNYAQFVSSKTTTTKLSLWPGKERLVHDNSC